VHAGVERARGVDACRGNGRGRVHAGSAVERPTRAERAAVRGTELVAHLVACAASRAAIGTAEHRARHAVEWWLAIARAAHARAVA
jgi:hypothetical protein